MTYIRSLKGGGASYSLGVDGPMIKGSASDEVKMENAACDGLAKVQLLDGTAATHAVTKAQLDAVSVVVTAVQALLATDDVALDQAQEWLDFMKANAADIASLSSSLSGQVAALQADIDQNETDADSALVALQGRAAVLEAFKVAVDAGISFVVDGSVIKVVMDDIIVNGNVYVNGVKLFDGSRKIQNVTAMDDATRDLFAAHAIADAASRSKVRFVSVLGNGAGTETAFGTVLPAMTQVLRVKVKVLQAFDANSSLTVGHANAPASLMTVSGSDMQNVDLYIKDLASNYASGEQLVYQINGATAGSAEISVEVGAY